MPQKLTGQLLAFARSQALQPEIIDVAQSLTVAKGFPFGTAENRPNLAIR
jgi:hypothetical protein